MTKGWKFASLSLLVLLGACVIAPISQADQWDKETVVTFGSPIEVPGRILPAGTYVFKLANASDRRVVQIFTKDQRKLVATIPAVPDYHLTPTEKPLISFAERSSGRPEAVQSWFYPGDNYGVRFVYPESTAERATNSQQVASEQPATTAARATEAAAPPAQASNAEDSANASSANVSRANASDASASDNHNSDANAFLAQEGGQPSVPQQTPVQPLLIPASLPETAGNFLALPLIGLALLSGGSTILRKLRKRSYRE